MTVYTFWEPHEKMPVYLQLCMETWKKFLPDLDVVVLDYKNIGDYIDIDKDLGPNLLSGRFKLMLIADAIRVALLAKHGGIWLDADTIILNANAKKYFLPDEENRTVFFGTPSTGKAHIAYINTPSPAQTTEKNTCLKVWLDFVQKALSSLTPDTVIKWDFFGNTFINTYNKNHKNEVKILDKNIVRPELELVSKETGINKQTCYAAYYFNRNHHLAEVSGKYDMLFLHNSWTPTSYKNFSLEDLLRCDCTLTNILAEALEMKIPSPNERFLFGSNLKK